ncbi:T-cell receptor gamma alternate reading frame protein isoform X2 [Strix aluco]|uniref:T-cell receptor gamma alternate reading frame protein isoform X2 n=1 Tax=Strix aluco TaxID=111821 RepID=UPI003DA3895E
MLLLAVLVATATWSYGYAQGIPIQKPLSVTKSKGSVRLECDFKDVSEYNDVTIIHWYQQKENEAPVRILYLAQSKVVDGGFQEYRYMVEKDPHKKMCILTINDVIPDDSATYYCAYWDRQVGYYEKVFGSGTKLIVSDEVISSPASSEILQKRHENQIMYVCLIEKFYPEVIRVTWTDEADKEVTDNIIKGDVWKPTNGDKYSIGSWLTVPAENKDKNYYCKYEHESQQRSLSTQDSRKTATQQKDCSPGNSTVNFNKDHLMHRTAYLVYIVLLLKSSMYYLIVLFLIYRMWAPTKHQGKKA